VRSEGPFNVEPVDPNRFTNQILRIVMLPKFLVVAMLSVCSLLAVPASRAHAQEPVRIIAHRGGVVDGRHPENSPDAAKEGIKRGYWMLEIDLQETKDGHIVVHHDDFMQSFGILKMPGEMTLADIKQLRATEDRSHPLEFDEYARLCKGKVQLMIDTKPPHHSQAFYESMEKTLRDNGLLAGAYFIGTSEARAHFKGKARISISREELERKLASGEDVSRDYFLFEHGTSLDAAGIALGKNAGIPVVASINDDHYAGRPHMMAAHADIVRLHDLGLTYFQIDSPYDVWLR
jgi:glycerophosphoryl diester phosphodiesterase